jgi:hypothetical protein
MDGGRRLAAFATALAIAGVGALSGSPAAAELRTITATQSGDPALDADPFGGNPFASALIAELALREGEAAPLDLAQRLAAATLEISNGAQAPDTHELAPAARLAPAEGETAIALVLVFADYGDEQGLASLPGATFDAYRIGRALFGAGYDVRTVIAADAAGYSEAVDQFALDAQAADRVLLYTTGHGVEYEGAIYVLPPGAERATNMLDRAIPLADVQQIMEGPGERLLIWAGCRDNPLGLMSGEF